METYSLTALRKQLYRVVDCVLETGVPVEIERKGQKLLLIPAQKTVSKLANLKKRKGIVGDPDDLVQLRVGEWNESDNLN
jgi:hypothetical protein